MKVHILDVSDIYLALAMEEALFKNLPKDEKALLLWSNPPAVVMGRFQNPWMECDMEKMEKHGVVLGRRQSGGGTVYHDHGNVNMSFLDWNEMYSKDLNNSAILGALKSLGYEAMTSGRSDIQIQEKSGVKKVSGAAFKKKKDRSFHHCTMLLNADLDNLNSFLKPKFDSAQVSTKAISSVRSNVANICVSSEKFFHALIASWEKELKKKSEVKRWTRGDCSEYVEEFASDYYEKLRSWKWIFGETPLFETTVGNGPWEVNIAIKKGAIKSLQVSHPDIHPSFLEEIGKAAIGRAFTKEDLVQAFESISGSAAYEEQVDKLVGLLASEFGLNFKV